MNILGINAYHGDSSACLIIDGKLIAAAEEERFTRIKHWAGLPINAINFCLKTSNLSLIEVDVIAINRNPQANFYKKMIFSLINQPNIGKLIDRFKNRNKIKNLSAALKEEFNIPETEIIPKIEFVEHHLAHLGSAFFVSPFESAAVISVDGFGDFSSTMWGVGNSNQIEILDQTFFPHSLGLFYLAITQYLGFFNYGDEYKVMGLAPYGDLTEMDKIEQIIHLRPNGQFELNLKYFIHHSEGVSMLWNGGEPVIGKVFSKGLEELLGPSRSKDAPLDQRYKNIAACAQAMYEKVFFHILNHVYEKTKLSALALAGGCAMNSVANGKIFTRTKFKDVYIQSAAGDAGGAIGAAYVVWNQYQKNPRSFIMQHAYWGPEFADLEIEILLSEHKDTLESQLCTVEKIQNEELLTQIVANDISQGLVIGWFQGRMEWGPRALGNRSILGDPRRADMKDILNFKIKRRESFRPFAPSILREKVNEWFETDYDVPFMLQVFQIRQELRAQIPAVTHVNGSGRLQTVLRSTNSRYYKLIETFEQLTGVPIVLNTSFNENEPVVCRPQEALDCFLRTKMDVLVMEDFILDES
jgi:carbamoyltransferase